MPRTKPQEIKPESDSSIGWDDVAGADEAKAELAGGRRVPARPGALPQARRQGARRASCCTARPAPARRCWPRPSPTSPARSSSRSRPPRSSRCSPASAPRASGGCSPRPASTARRSSSSTRSTPSAAQRGSDNNSEREQTLNQLLVEMDGFGSTGDLVVIAASNLLEKLDPRAAAPGPLRPPDLRLAARRRRPRGDPASVHTRDKPLGADVDLALVARQTSGLTGADLANICQRGGDLRRARGAARGSRQADFDAALERVVAGMQSRRALNEHERRVVAFHEAGHALCAELLPGRRPRAQDLDRPARPGARLHAEPARGGPLPQDARGADRPHDRAARRPRGRGDRLRRDHHRRRRTTCTRVAEISRAMVHEYAMGTSITSRKVSAEGGAVSDRTRELRDEEQQHLADEAMRRRVAAAPRAPRRSSTQLAHALLRNEVLERDDIERIMAGDAAGGARARRGAARRRLGARRPRASEPLSARPRAGRRRARP